MQVLAAWLVARPQNAILGLAATLLLPFGQVLSGTVMVLLALVHSPRLALAEAAAATALLGAISLLVGASASQVLMNALLTWLPAMLLALLMRNWRSLTLTMQVTAIVAMITTVGFFLVLGDPTGFWNGVLDDIAATFRELDLEQQADILLERRALIAPQMTVLFVFLSWSMYVLVLLLGYALMQTLPGRTAEFGRFCDLNFGRVLALIMAVASVLAVFVGAVWLQNFAFVMFAIFWVQGLALLHWLHAEGRLPVFLLIAVYAMVPFLNALLVVSFAIVGYTDAWFDYRSRKHVSSDT